MLYEIRHLGSFLSISGYCNDVTCTLHVLVHCTCSSIELIELQTVSHSLYLFTECSLKQLDEQVLLSVVLCIVEHGQDHVLHEPVGLVLRHLKQQLSQVDRMSLEQVEQVLVVL